MKLSLGILPKVVLCHLVGLKFSAYNDSLDFPNAQLAITDGIPLLNHCLSLVNREISVRSPLLGSIIHTTKKKARIPHYAKLTDGVHLNDNTLERFAFEIVRSLPTNLDHIRHMGPFGL